MTERLDNGARRRRDGGGSAFGNLHRERLPRGYFMQDIDLCAGLFAMKSENGVFYEYAVTGSAIAPLFAFCAFFDLKQSDRACEVSPLRRQSLCALARMLRQPLPPAVFEVVGVVEPFAMHELNIETASRSGRTWQAAGDWLAVWQAAGLVSVREELSRWLITTQGNHHDKTSG